MQSQRPRLANCSACAKRKVRCDKSVPCGHCKRRKEACFYPRIFATTERDESATSHSKEKLGDRVERLEQYVKTLGGDLAVVDDFNITQASKDEQNALQTNDSQTVKLHDLCVPVSSSTSVHVEGGSIAVRECDQESQFIQAPVWFSWSEANRIPEEDRKQYESLSNSEDQRAANLFGSPMSIFNPVLNTGLSAPLHNQHPPSNVIDTLWQTFKGNVHPMINIFFPWQKEPLMRKAAIDAECLSQADEVLVFAIYLIAILSMQGQECNQLMQQSKTDLLHKYQLLLECALLRARFIDTSSYSVLQGFLIYILVMRNRTRPSTVFSLLGIAVRNAERLGLHRESSLKDIDPIQAEERRRLWWQMQHAEVSVAQVLGCTSMSLYADWDTHCPANLNDDDVRPGMISLPPERSGLTSMSHCLWRYAIFALTRERNADGKAGPIGWIWIQRLTIAERDAKVDLMEKALNERFIQYCEPLVPLHVHLQIGIRSVILAARRVSRQPALVNAKVSQLPHDEREKFLELCSKCLHYYVLLETTDSLAHFAWHSENYFQWTAFAYVLIEASHRAQHPSSESLWDLIDKVCSVHPKLLTATHRPDIASIGRLILRAWRQREQHLLETSNFGLSPPRRNCIKILQDKLGWPQTLDPTNPNPSRNATQAIDLLQVGDAEDQSSMTLNEMAAEFDMIDWAFWDGLGQGLNGE